MVTSRLSARHHRRIDGHATLSVQPQRVDVDFSQQVAEVMYEGGESQQHISECFVIDGGDARARPRGSYAPSGAAAATALLPGESEASPAAPSLHTSTKMPPKPNTSSGPN